VADERAGRRAAAPEHRFRWTLTAKLIAAIGVLLVAAVAVSTWASLRTIEEQASAEAASRRSTEQTTLERQAKRLARNTAASAALPVAEGNFTYLSQLVEATIQEDSRLRWIAIADVPTYRVLARAGTAPPGELLEDSLREQLLAAPAGTVLLRRDPSDSSLFVFGTALQVGTRTVGQLRLGLSTSELEAELARSIEAARERGRASARSVALAALGVLLAGIALGAVQGVRIARPLKALAQQAEQIASGDLDQRVEVRSRDEIGRLAANFNFMAERLGELLVQTAAKASLDREMSLARELQRAMVPRDLVHVHGAVRVIGYCEAATACGGDWWTLQKLDGGRVLIVIADVTGHGMASAMIAANARGALEALAATDQRLLTPEGVLKTFDRVIRDIGDRKLLMSCFVALLDPARGILDYANAGHNFPYLFPMAGETHCFDKPKSLGQSGNWLGDSADVPLARSGRDRLRPGDLLLLFTDGVVERAAPDGRQFGDRRLIRLVSGRGVTSDETQLLGLRDHILAGVEKFAAGQPAADDVTLVLCQIDPNAVAAPDAVVRRGLVR